MSRTRLNARPSRAHTHLLLVGALLRKTVSALPHTKFPSQSFSIAFALTRPLPPRFVHCIQRRLPSYLGQCYSDPTCADACAPPRPPRPFIDQPRRRLLSWSASFPGSLRKYSRRSSPLTVSQLCFDFTLPSPTVRFWPGNTRSFPLRDWHYADYLSDCFSCPPFGTWLAPRRE